MRSRTSASSAIFKLRKSVTPNFWVNVFDLSMKIPGFVDLLPSKSDAGHDRLRPLLHADHERELAAKR